MRHLCIDLPGDCLWPPIARASSHTTVDSPCASIAFAHVIRLSNDKTKDRPAVTVLKALKHDAGPAAAVPVDAVGNLERTRGPIGAALLKWYDRDRRDLPWRTPIGKRQDTYRVWLSEVMLQQTTVKAVIPYYLAFLERWPTLSELAKAPLDDILAAWAGLGYYSRARKLHACARVVMDNHGGRFPRDPQTLETLPGIGPYTAAAIAAIAFDSATLPVDGNVERVVARLAAVETPLPAAKPELRRLASALVPSTRTGDFAQAMMDLGATVCSPRKPSCMICPLKPCCRAQLAGLVSDLPRRSPKPERPLRHGFAFVALSESGSVLLRKRPERGLLGGMMEVPTTDWQTDWLPPEEALRTAPVKSRWIAVPGAVTHTFTHFRLGLLVYRAHVRNDPPLTLWSRQADCRWVSRTSISSEALPSVMRKVIAHALDDMQ
jgi:A/G-specific adenine glycosylase